MFLNSVKVKNFRSLVDVDVELDGYTAMVGLNDAGKSNLLRALNLFFNGQTDLGEALDFQRDFSQNAKVSLKKARQIEVELVLTPPANYQDKGRIVWRKTYRADDSGAFTDDLYRQNGESFSKGSRVEYRSSRMSAINDVKWLRTLVALIAVTGVAHSAPSDAAHGDESPARPPAQNGIRPSYDGCLQKANTTADMAACSNEEYAYQDKRLNDAYKGLMSTLSAAKQSSLRAEERKWVAFKIKHCKPPAGSGTLAIVESSQCAVDETAKRARELERRSNTR